MRQVAASRPHRLRQDDVRRQFVFPSLQKFQRTTGVWRVDPPGEQSTGLHHLMAGIVDSSGGVVAGSDQRKFISQAVFTS